MNPHIYNYLENKYLRSSKNLIFLLCAIFTFSVASAQATQKKTTTTPVTTNCKTDKTKATAVTTNSVQNNNSGIIDPTEAPAEGANSRDNSRQSNYNKTAATSGTTPSTGTTQTTSVKDDNSGLIDPTEAPTEGANSRDNSRQSSYNKEVKK
jgi:hypothetical protein